MSENPHWRKFVAIAIIVGFVASLITVSQIVPWTTITQIVHWEPNQATSSSIVTTVTTGSQVGPSFDFQLRWVSSADSNNPLKASIDIPVCSPDYDVIVYLQVVPTVGTPNVRLYVEGTPGAPGMQTVTRDPFWGSHIVSISSGPYSPLTAMPETALLTAPEVYYFHLWFGGLTPSMAGSTDPVNNNSGLTIIGQSAMATQKAVLEIRYVSC